MTIVPEFVERVPTNIEQGVIYISTSVNTAIHLCPCGCKTEIVTPLDPDEWSFTYDGETITLYPSVGVWGAECKSHYWIKKSKVEWSRMYSNTEIEEVRASERRQKSDKSTQDKGAKSWWRLKWPFGTK